MTWKQIDVADLGDYVGYLVRTTVDLGWGDDCEDEGFLVAVGDSSAGPFAYFDSPECEPDEWWKPGQTLKTLDGAALWCITEVHVDVSGEANHPYVPKNR